MKRPLLLDTGPLVAFINRRDRHHAWARTRWAEARSPLLTCEAVISEACFLLSELWPGSRAVMELLIRGVVAVPFRLETEAALIARLMAKYQSVPMSVADACLVRMAEEVPESSVLTLDGDFRIYRKHGRQAIPTIMPEERARR